MAIDYQSIIEDLDDNKVQHLLDELNIPYQDKGDFLLLPTCCHHHLDEDMSWKLYYYKNTHIFHCFTNDGSQSIFTFLKNFYTAQGYNYDWYTDIYQVILKCSAAESTLEKNNGYRSIRDNYSIKKTRQQLEAYPESILETFIKYYPIEWLNDGISKAAMDKFNIRYSPTQNKIIIPHYDAAGRLVGIRGRALNKWEIENIGKYMPVQIENKWYSHPLSLNLYGLNFNKETIKQTGVAYIAEGEKSCLQAESFSIPNCVVASCGNKFNKYQLDLLLRTCQPREIVLCYDQEELKNSQLYFDKLYNTALKYKQYTNISFVYDKAHILQLKQSPFDVGEEKFLQLIKTRIKL